LLWDKGHYEHGKKKGTWMIYNESGEILKEVDLK
jgi:antitoxin component YwqK of YwqJK toxin-antitoxin module